jgi:hypothetical protein
MAPIFAISVIPGSELLIAPQICGDHCVGRKAAARDPAALLRIDIVRAVNCFSHARRVLHQKAGSLMHHDFGKRADRKCNHWCAAGGGFHCHQGAGLGDQAGHDQATRRRE